MSEKKDNDLKLTEEPFALLQGKIPKGCKIPRKERPKLTYHGCFTGDCPHTNANECVESLKGYVSQMEIDEESLQSQLTAANATIAGLRAQVDKWRPMMEKEGCVLEQLTAANAQIAGLTDLIQKLTHALDANLPDEPCNCGDPDC